jgi:hypothetical protein
VILSLICPPSDASHHGKQLPGPIASRASNTTHRNLQARLRVPANEHHASCAHGRSLLPPNTLNTTSLGFAICISHFTHGLSKPETVTMDSYTCVYSEIHARTKLMTGSSTREDSRPPADRYRRHSPGKPSSHICSLRVAFAARLHYCARLPRVPAKHC